MRTLETIKEEVKLAMLSWEGIYEEPNGVALFDLDMDEQIQKFNELTETIEEKEGVIDDLEEDKACLINDLKQARQDRDSAIKKVEELGGGDDD